MAGFADLRLAPDLLEAVRDVGYETPTPIQEQAIPPLLQGLDLIGQAQTGSGKTAAFGLPLLQYVDPSEAELQALVLTPTTTGVRLGKSDSVTSNPASSIAIIAAA